MDSSPTSWSRPVNSWLVPVLLLALGVFVILFDGLGLQSGLSNRLFDAYQRHAARPFADTDGAPVRVLELPSNALTQPFLTPVGIVTPAV